MSLCIYSGGDTGFEEKDAILEAYLNTINLGQNTLGIQAASNRYFGKDVSELSVAEGAVLAGIAKNPEGYNPIRNPEDNKNRNIPLADLGLPPNVYFALSRRGDETAGDIADLTPFAWKQIKQLKQHEIVAVQAKLKELGLRIKK